MQIVLRCFVATGGRAVTRFVNAWADGVLVGGILRLIVTDIFAHLDRRTALTSARRGKSASA